MICSLCKNKEVSFFEKIEDFRYYICERCEFIFTPDIDKKKMESLYSQGRGGLKDGAPIEGWCSDLEFLYSVKELLNEKDNLKIMDFGTGHSILPDLLYDLGHDVTGIDLCPPEQKVRYSRITGDIFKLDLEEESFDIIISYQVFEHLAEPRKTLKKLLSCLKTKGFLIIHTNMETEERTDNLSDWDYVQPPDHCSLYRHKSFETISEEFGYEIIAKDPWTISMKKLR